MGISVIRSTELVKPSEVTPHGPFWLSNLDLNVRSGYSPMIYLFRPGGEERSDEFYSANVLRTALARALVPFYPLAGRLGMASDGRVEIDCNGKGAVFVVAHSNAAIGDFEDFTPSKAMCNMFVPRYEKFAGAGAGAPLLLLQVTFIRGGGVVLGTGMHHYALDGRSSFHFVQTWAAMARGAADGAIVPPFFDRTPLRARSPPVFIFDHSHEYTAGSATCDRPPSELTGAILRVTSAQAAMLRARTGESLFRSIVAHIWRCTLMARGLPTDAKSRLYTVVDMRARLSPPLPSAYFGNAGVRTSVSAKVGDIVANPLIFGAKRLRKATGHGDEFARSLVDYLETADDRSKPGRELPDTDLRVISWIGMPTHDADFGWGELVLLAPAAVSYTWFIYNIGNTGDVAVAVAMKPDHLERFKALFLDENEMTW